MNEFIDIILASFAELSTAALMIAATIAFMRSDMKNTITWNGLKLGIFLLAISSVLTILESFFLAEVFNIIEHICNMVSGIIFAWVIYTRITQSDKYTSLYEI